MDGPPTPSVVSAPGTLYRDSTSSRVYFPGRRRQGARSSGSGVTTVLHGASGGRPVLVSLGRPSYRPFTDEGPRPSDDGLLLRSRLDACGSTEKGLGGQTSSEVEGTHHTHSPSRPVPVVTSQGGTFSYRCASTSVQRGLFGPRPPPVGTRQSSKTWKSTESRESREGLTRLRPSDVVTLVLHGGGRVAGVPAQKTHLGTKGGTEQTSDLPDRGDLPPVRRERGGSHGVSWTGFGSTTG